MRGDDQIITEGGKPHNAAWKPCKVDRVLNDGDTVTLGEAVMTAHLTPGHTRGCTTWTMKVKDAGKTFDVVIVGSVNVNPGYQLVNNKDYPEITGDYARTFRIMKALHCDIFLGAHGNYYGMEAKYARLKPGAANPFVDPEGYRSYIEEREQAYLNTLHQQQR
jgi:metallo-beta-lactamase class B